MVERQVIPLSEDELKAWRDRITKSRQVRQTVQGWWEANLKAYAPSQDGDPDEYGSNINTNRDFTLVERKKADLFYQSPDIAARPSPLFEGQEHLLDTHVAIVNEKLGLDGVNAKALVHQVLFDVLCPSGTGWTIMGYESATQDTPIVNPMTGIEEMIPVPVFEDCFWRWFSPKQSLVPHDFRSTQWDDAAWLGMEFEMPVRAAKRKGWVPEEFTGQPPDGEMYFDHGLSSHAGDAVAKGVAVYYKSSLFRDDIVHPQHMTWLVLMEGVDEPAEHKDSPYQTLDQQGALSPDSLIGNPIHPFTMRTLTDSSQVPSDCTISRPLVNELNAFRSDMVQQRAANILRWSYNVDTLPTDALGKIVRSPIGGFIGLPGDAFVGEGAIKELPHGTYPRENFQFNDYLDNDLARTHALDSNQQGVKDEGGTTATEAQIQQSNVNARLGLERGVVLDAYIRGVTKYSTLIQRYLPAQEAAAIVGPTKAQEWDGWRKHIPTRLAFTAMPDSALRSDTAADRKQAVELYSFLANDPNVNRVELLKNVLRKHHISPDKIVVQPPPKGPEPAKPTFAFKGEDCNPLAPQFAIVIEVMRQTGMQISPEAVQEAQAAAMTALMAAQLPSNDTGQGDAGSKTEHGGKQPATESLSKHAAALTGGMQGSGAPAPMGAGGGEM